MTFGQIIKKLRRDADMTQERLAELLSISPQAVSRWEIDAAMPDVSLLPPLANLFNVTTDYLLGVDIAKRNERINRLWLEICEVGSNVINEEFYLKMLEKARNALKLYPDSEKLKNELASTLRCLLRYCEKDSDRFRAYADEMKAVCESIIAGSHDQNERLEAISCLCLTAKDTGNIKRAKELCGTLPKLYYSRESMRSMVLEGDEFEDSMRDYIATLSAHINGAFDELAKGKTPEIMRSYYQKERDIRKILYDDDDYVKSAFWDWDREYYWALEFAKIGDNDDAFECLENSLRKYIYGAEHGYTDISELHDINVKWDMTDNTPSLGVIHEEYCRRIKGMHEDIEREFPESFKNDTGYEPFITKIQGFIEKYGK